MYSWDSAAWFTEAFIRLESREPDPDVSALARAHHVVGGVYHRHGRPELAVEHYEAALDLWDSIQARLQTAKVVDDLLRWHATYAQDRPSRMKMVQRAEAAIAELGSDHPATTGRLLETLATVYGLGRDRLRARDYSVRARSLALKNDDFELVARLSTATALPYLNALDPTRAATAWEEGVQYSERLRDDVRRVRCLHRLPMPYFLMGRFDDVLTTTQQAEKLNYALPRSGELSLALVMVAHCNILRAEWANADSISRRATEVILESGYYWGTPFLLTALIRRDVLRDELHLSAPRFQLSDSTPFEKAMLPIRRFVELYIEKDYKGLSVSMHGTMTDSDIDVNTMSLVGMLIEAASLSESAAPDLSNVRSKLEEVHGRGNRYFFGWPCSIDRLIGVAYFLNEEFEEATKWLRSGLESNERLGALSEIPIGLAYLAACESRVGNSSNARRVLANGERSAVERGMSSYYTILTNRLGM
jgi:tetratricopeptide (TPR) repeat protein